MTWLAPLALAGLAAVALPVLVHWLARHEANRRLFPTVRFLPHTPPTSVRRHRLTDRALLALRAGIVAAAVAALAQPALVTPPAPGGRPPQAVIVDTSASMTRTLVDGRTGAAAADAAVASVPDAGVVIRTADLRDGLAQAGAWLRSQPGAGEVVVISDFQVGAVTDADFDALPASAGRRLVRVAVTGDVPAPAGAGAVRVYGAAAAEAAARAVVGKAPAPDTTAPAIVIAFQGAPEFDALRAGAASIDSPALYELATRVDPEMTSGAFFVASDNPKKAPDVISGSGLIVLSSLPADSVDAAALVARALRAAAEPAVAPAEREPDALPAGVIDRWQRAPRPDLAPRSGDPQPLGRWVWLLVLGLLGLEAWVRRSRPPAVIAPAHIDGGPHARVA